MADMTSLKPSATFESILKIGTGNNQCLDTTLRVVEDGTGEASALYLATDSVLINGTNKLYFGDADGGEYISGNNDDLTITAGTDILLAPGSNVGIGTTTPVGRLHIEQSDAWSKNYNSTVNNILLSRDEAAAEHTVAGITGISGTLAFAQGPNINYVGAAICGTQTGGNDAEWGLSFWCHPSTLDTDVIVEKMTLDEAGHLTPGADNTQNLGSAAYSWNDIYYDGTTLTSDKRLKDNISDSVLGLNFINKLRAVSYKRKDRTIQVEKASGVFEDEAITYKRRHYGLISQEVKQVMDDMGIDSNDFAGYVDANITEDVDKLFLRYTEFIAPMIKAIQELSAEVEKLKA